MGIEERRTSVKAIAIQTPGPDSILSLEERATPVPAANEALVKVVAFGVNRADLLQRAGRYPAPPGTVQDIPGLEFAGVIEKLEVSTPQWNEGDKVMGIVPGGAYAQYVVTPVQELLPIPGSLSMRDAASIPEAYVTAWDALVLQGEMKPGAHVLIHAAGSGVGLAAIELCHAFGAIPVGTSRSSWKLEQLNERYGMQTVERTGNWWTEAREFALDGFDVVLDLVGGPEVNESLKLLKSRGRLIVVGLTAGVRSEIRLDVLLGKRATVRGTVLRSRSPEEKSDLMARFTESVLPLFEEGILRSLCREAYPVGMVEQAHRKMSENKTFGKLVIEGWEAGE